MKALYFVTTGINDPTTASIPLHLAANGSLEVGHDVEVVLAGHATDILLGDNVNSTQGIGVPSMRELFDKLKNHGVPVYV